MVVSEEDDKITSLGRSESHVSIRLEPTLEATTVESILSRAKSTAQEGGGDEGPFEYKEGDVEVMAWLTSEDDHHCDGERDSVTLVVPEKVNIVCELERGGSIDVTNKLEGDARLMTTDGDIRVKKLRGYTVDLETRSTGSIIYATDLLEAYKLKLSMLQGGRLRAKRIHGESVDIQVTAPHNNLQEPSAHSEALDEDDDGSLIDVSSMYVSGAGGAQVSLRTGLRPEKRAVRIKSHHGPVLVDIEGVHRPTMKNMMLTKGDDKSSMGEGHHYPLVELGSVNGSCEVSIRTAPTNECVDDWTSCQIHYDSISPESVSLIHCDVGNVALTFDRKLEADLRLLSSSDVGSLEDTAGILADEDDTEQIRNALSHLKETPKAAPQIDASRIFIQTQSYTENERYISPNKVVEYVEGWVENRSHEPDSRFEMKTRGEAHPAGKIRHDGAADQALQRFSSPKQSGDADPARPLIVAATSGTISVETLSWLGAIARRYGVDEKGKSLGRQAARRGRPVLPADE